MANDFKFELHKATNGQWTWKFYSTANHRSIAWAGETYHNKADALNGINLVKKFAPTAEVVERSYAY